MSGGTSTMRTLIERFRNAPPMPREEREKLRTSSGGERGNNSSSLWWQSQAQKMDETVLTVKNELDSMEKSFGAFTDLGLGGAAGSSSRWAGVGGFPASSASATTDLAKLSP